MAEWTLKYADARGEIRQQVAIANSERELRDRYTQQGFLIYSIKPHGEGVAGFTARRPKLNVEKFLIFNQQFVTLIRAGLPILKALDLLADRLTDPKLGQAHPGGARRGPQRARCCRTHFPRRVCSRPIYVTSIMAGEKSGALGEVLERFIAYQKLALAVKKKILPFADVSGGAVISLVLCLMVFLITYVVPKFAELYTSMQASLPMMTQLLIAVGTTARGYVVPDLWLPDRGRYRTALLCADGIRQRGL